MAIFQDLEWDASYVPAVKLGIHVLQIVFAFAVFVMEIVLFRAEDAVINGRNGWTFGLVCPNS